MSRSLLSFFASLPLLTVSACGPSAAELQRAHDAHYRGTPIALLDGAEAAALAAYYKVYDRDDGEGTLVTVRKLFTADGGVEGVGTGDVIQYSDRSIALTYVVRVARADDGGFTVEVEPKVQRLFVGRPNPDDVPVGDPTMPGWVIGRTEALTVAIHDRLAEYEARREPVTE